MRCLHGRDSVKLARATRRHVPTMYMDTREQLCVSNNEICEAAVAAQANKKGLLLGGVCSENSVYEVPTWP